MDSNILSHIDRLVDWKGFENFVGDLYEKGSEITVQRNVTEIGKSQTKRQVDVLVFQKTQFHNIKIIIECKYWSVKVDRDVVDKMFATVEDLNANKGVIFTTKGYEEGALKYAQSKNIDIFIVRDVLEEEWGKLGSQIYLYTQTFTSVPEAIQLLKSNYISITGNPPTEDDIELNIKLSKDLELKDEYQLYSLPGYDENKTVITTEYIKGPNFVKLLLDIQKEVLSRLMKACVAIVVPEDQTHNFVYRQKVKIAFSEYPNRFLPYGEGHTKLEEVNVTFLQGLTQSKIIVDRKKPYDLMLMVEDYITNQKHFVSKKKDSEDMEVVGPIIPNEKRDMGDFKNGSVIKIMMDYYIQPEVKLDTKIEQRPDLTINLVSKQAVEQKMA